MEIVPCIQGSVEWFQARCGKVTGSEVVNVMAFGKRGDKKGSELAARADYKVSIISELLTGQPDMDSGFATDAMNRGIDEEPKACLAYEMITDDEVTQVGFVLHPTIELAGASPDRLVGTAGILEVKCPKSRTHLSYLLADQLPPEYEPQVMFELACTGREWCDFISYDRRFPRQMGRMLVKRFYRDEARIAEINGQVEQFLAECFDVIEQLRKRYGKPLVLPTEYTVSPLPLTASGDVDLSALADQIAGDITQ